MTVPMNCWEINYLCQPATTAIHSFRYIQFVGLFYSLLKSYSDKLNLFFFFCSKNLAHYNQHDCDRKEQRSHDIDHSKSEDIVLLEKQGKCSQKMRNNALGNLAEVTHTVGHNMTDISNIGNISTQKVYLLFSGDPCFPERIISSLLISGYSSATRPSKTTRCIPAAPCPTPATTQPEATAQSRIRSSQRFTNQSPFTNATKDNHHTIVIRNANIQPETWRISEMQILHQFDVHGNETSAGLPQVTVLIETEGLRIDEQKRILKTGIHIEEELFTIGGQSTAEDARGVRFQTIPTADRSQVFASHLSGD